MRAGKPCRTTAPAAVMAVVVAMATKSPVVQKCKCVVRLKGFSLITGTEWQYHYR